MLIAGAVGYVLGMGSLILALWLGRRWREEGHSMSRGSEKLEELRQLFDAATDSIAAAVSGVIDGVGAVGTRMQALLDEVGGLSGGVSADGIQSFRDKMQAELDQLNGATAALEPAAARLSELGKDPENPVPAEPPVGETPGEEPPAGDTGGQ